MSIIFFITVTTQEIKNSNFNTSDIFLIIPTGNGKTSKRIIYVQI